MRDSARALGLIIVRKGRLTPTAAAARCRSDASALWEHSVGRLPLGSTDADREAGWIALAVVASGVPPRQWHSEISDLLFALGWRSETRQDSRPVPDSPTLDVLHQLAGDARHGRRRNQQCDEALAATARAIIRRRA